ncbi:uncharacterized protein [Hetaerina americana]|uniref:uncharacterized protein n=1 Tax=Hetaerina americana TaxID=62018 RepID=UPI003A7F5F95
MAAISAAPLTTIDGGPLQTTIDAATVREAARGDEVRFKLGSQLPVSRSKTSDAAVGTPGSVQQTADGDGASSLPPVDTTRSSTMERSKKPSDTARRHWYHNHHSGKALPPQSHETLAAGALTGALFVGMALFGYLGLICWRRSLELKYGNRELLVNEREEGVVADGYQNYMV